MTILCFEAHHRDGRVWAIRHRNRWIRTRKVSVQARCLTGYKGPRAAQPKAFIAFLWPVKLCREFGGITIKAA